MDLVEKSNRDDTETVPNSGPELKRMYCPNCAAENRSEQNYCRCCGLRLDAISQFVGEQFPTKEYAALQKRKELFEKLGLFSLSMFGFLLFALVFAKAVYYKIILFGEEIIFGAGFAAFVIFGLLSVFFFNYPKLFMKFDKLNPRLSPQDDREVSRQTGKLIEDRPFEPIGSVTDDSTELLSVKNKTKTS
jgi:hypothetical protein